jgi:hypothetical protein
MRKLTALVLLALAAICMVLLLSGTSYAERVLPGGLPLGNALASVGLSSFAGTAFYVSPVQSVRRRISGTVLVGAVLWLPISIALAGNLALNFSGSRGTVWMIFSYATLIAVLGSLTFAIAGELRNLFHGTSAG